MKECQHDSFPLYKQLIGPLREKARELGYALAVHGTLKRDIDLIACPWTSEAVDARTLAEALLKVAADNNKGLAFLKPVEDNGYFWVGCPGNKPHGRLVWSIHLGGGPYIDLSVMPQEPKTTVAWIGQKDERGCGIAAAAMITGHDYDTVLAWMAERRTERGGLYLRDIDDYLTEHGFAIARKYQFRFGKETTPWPCAPFSAVHLCEVTVADNSPCNHFVVTLADGTCLDPLTEQPRELKDYHRVLNVAAVVSRLRFFTTGEEIVRAREEAERRGPMKSYVNGREVSGAICD